MVAALFFGRKKQKRAELPIPAIEVNDQVMRAHATHLSRRGVERAIRRALNKCLNKAFTQAKREIAKKRNIKAKDVAADLRKVKATSTNAVAGIRARGRSIPATALKGAVTQTKKGVKLNAGRGRRLEPGAFIATMPNGKVGVFERTRNKGFGSKRVKKGEGADAYWSELPIQEIRFPSVAATLVQKDVQALIQETVNRAWQVEIARAIRLEEKKIR